MSIESIETINHIDFDKRLDLNNARLRQELVDMQNRVQQLEMLITRKEIFSQRLDQILTELESEENEIASLTKSVHSTLIPSRKRSRNAQSKQ